MKRIIQKLKHERYYSNCTWFLTGIILLLFLGIFYLNVSVVKAQEPDTYRAAAPGVIFEDPTPALPFTDAPLPTSTPLPNENNPPPLKPAAHPKIKTEKSVDPSIANPGHKFTFTIDIKNTGGAPAFDIVVTDTFPDALIISDVETTKGHVIINQNQVTINIGSLDASKSVTITVETKAKSDILVDLTLYNTAYITYSDGVNIYSISTNTVMFQIVVSPIPTPTGHPQIYADKIVEPLSVQAGEHLTFTIRLKNTGGSQAINIVVQDVFPNLLTLDSVDTTKGHGKINQNQVLVTIDSLGVDKTVTITVYATAKQNVSGNVTLYNTAYITFSDGVNSYSVSTNTVAFQITTYGAGGLPATGGIELNPGSPCIVQIPITVGVFLIILGTGLSVVKYRLRAIRSSNHPWYFNIATLLIVSGMILSLTACAIDSSKKVAEQVPALEKPTILSTETPNIQIAQPVINISTPTLEALPDYPIPTPPLLEGSDNDGMPKDISPVKRIVIPDIDLDTIVKYVPFEGNTWPIAGLKTEVIWMGNTSWPGLGGNTGLSGHVTLEDGSDGPFKNLSKLTAGDQVVLYTEFNKYIYSVRDKQIVSENEISVLNSADQSMITMVTCSDWSIALKRYLSRLVVYSDLIEVQPIGNSENQ